MKLKREDQNWGLQIDGLGGEVGPAGEVCQEEWLEGQATPDGEISKRRRERGLSGRKRRSPCNNAREPRAQELQHGPAEGAEQGGDDSREEEQQ